MHELHVVGVFDGEFRWDLNEVGVGFGQFVALQIEEVVVFMGGENFLLNYEIVGIKQAHLGSRKVMGDWEHKSLLNLFQKATKNFSANLVVTKKGQTTIPTNQRNPKPHGSKKTATHPAITDNNFNITSTWKVTNRQHTGDQHTKRNQTALSVKTNQKHKLAPAISRNLRQNKSRNFFIFQKKPTKPNKQKNTKPTQR